ncbi:MAG: BrnA antitoxin family protein [Betaproteobacteria bacterium]
MNGNKRGTVSTWTDPDDAPELDDDFFERADEYEGHKLIKRGRPLGSGNKISTTIRFDAEIVAAFRADGPGWQSRMNEALREWLSQRRAN